MDSGTSHAGRGRLPDVTELAGIRLTVVDGWIVAAETDDERWVSWQHSAATVSAEQFWHDYSGVVLGSVMMRMMDGLGRRLVDMRMRVRDRVWGGFRLRHPVRLRRLQPSR